MPLVQFVRRRPWLTSLGAVAILGFVSLAVLHTPPVRKRMLAWVASRLEASGLVFHADRLDYDLTRLDVRLHGLTMATPDTANEPFLRAGEVHARFGWAVLLGRIDVDVLEIANPRVTLVRTAGGTVNWPSSQGQVGQAREVGQVGRAARVRISDLVVVWRDALSGVTSEAAGLSLDLTPIGGGTSGPLRLAGPARVRWNSRDTRIDALDGRLAWNGRDLSIDALRLALAEGRLRIDGRVEALTSDPRLVLHLVSDSDLAAVAPWLSLDRRLTGGVRIDATVTGPPSAADVVMMAKGRDVGFDDLQGIQVETSARLAGNAAELTALTVRVAGGSVNGRGRMAVNAGTGTMTIDWQQLDLPTLIGSALGREIRPSPGAVATGSMTAQWTAPRLEALTVRGESRLIAAGTGAGAAGRRTKTPARLPLEGSITLDIERRHLVLRAESGIGESDGPDSDGRKSRDARTQVRVDLTSSLDAADLQRSSLGGAIQVDAPNLAATAGVFRRAGLTDAPALSAGMARARFALGGTFGDPRLDGQLEAHDVRYAGLNPATLRTRVSATRTEIRLDDIRGDLDESSAHGALRLNVASGRIGGQIDAALNDFTGLTTAAGLPVRVDGALDGTVIVSGSIRSPQVAATMTSSGLAAAGQSIDELQADLRLDNRAVVIDRLSIGMNPENLANPANLANPSRAGRLEARGRIDLARHTYEVHAIADRLAVRPVSDINGKMLVPLATTVSGEIDGNGSLTNLSGGGRLTLSGTHWDRVDVGRIEAEIAAEGRRVSADIRAPDVAVTAHAAAGVDRDGPIVVHGRWEPEDVAAIARRFGWSPPFPFSGSAALGLDIEGYRDQLTTLRLTAVIDRVDLDVDNQRVQLEQAARLEYDGRTALIRDLRLTTGSSTLTIAGSLGEPASPGLTATLRGSLADFVFVRRLAQSAMLADAQSAIRNPQSAMLTTGSIDVRIDATGPLARPVLSGTLRVSDGQWPLTPQHAVTGAHLNARYVAGVLTIEQLQAGFQGAALDGSGRIPADLFRDWLPPRWHDLVPPSPGPADLTMRVSSLTPEIAAPFLDPATIEQLQGRIDASIALQADHAALERLTGTVTLDRAELSVAGVSFDQQRPTRLVVRNGRVDVADWDWGRGDNHLVLSGGLMLGGTQALDITARTALDLRLLGAFTGRARPGGRADAQIRVGGTVNDPAVDGFVTFANGELRVANPRLIVSDLTGTLTFARDTITLERLWAAVNGGGTEIAGSVHHRWFKPIDGAITIRGREAAIEFAGLRAEAEADIMLALEPRGPVISGTATLVRSSYREPLSLTGGLLQTLRASSAFGQPAMRSALDDVRVDVRVVTGDDLVVDNNYARLAASANLRLVGTAAQPIPIGRVALAEGGVIFFGGNRYRIAGQGSIDFTNPTAIEPDVDLRAITNVNAAEELVEVTLTLKGTPATLQTTLDSSPWYSQSDLVSLLVTGRTAANAVAGGYTAGAEELLGYLSGELFGTAARAIGVDVIRVERGTPGVRFDAGLVASETDPAARLTFGKNIGRNTDVVFSQSLRESGGLTWIVSYAPRSQAEVRAVALDSGDRLYDFRHDVVFGQRRAAPARTFAPEPRVSAVTISGAGADEKSLRQRLHLDAGDRFSFFRWQDDRDRLEAFYHDHDHAEARVTTRRSSDAAGAATAIGYEVRPGPRTSIVIEGFAFPRRVDDALKSAWTHAVIDEFLIAEVETIVRGELADRGFVRASVAAMLSDAASDPRQLRVMVESGPHARDRRIVFEGNRQISTERLREAVRDPELARAVWLNPDRVRERLTALYRSEGYLNASVRLGDVVLEGDIAMRTIAVNEGEPFHLREVRVEGVNALPATEITGVPALAAGATFSEGLIERARRAITERYRKQGFNSVAVTLRTEAVAERSEVDVTITVEEGAQQRVREIVTSGLVRTRPELVARALKLEVGQPVNLVDWSSARRRLYETGVFRSVDIEPEPMATAGAESSSSPEQPIRARVALEEWPALRLRYGLEIQDERRSAGDGDGAAGAAGDSGGGGRTFDIGVASDLAVRNLLGRAVSAGIAGRYTRDFRAARTYLTLPSLRGMPITSNVFLSRSREQRGSDANLLEPKFVSDVTALTLEQRIHPRPKLEVAYRYAFGRNHTVELDPPPDEPPLDITARVARLGWTAFFDTRDDLVDATRGWFHSSDLEYAPPALGSDLRFVKYLLQHRYYRSTGRIVFAGAGQAGFASAFGQRLIPSERFFAGGGNSVRGYAEDALSPRDVLGAAIGGTALIVLNGEARFPVFKMVRGVGFFDAGRAFDSVKAIDLSDLSLGTGVGLRVQTPVVLLRVDFGVPLDRSFGPRRGRWFFSVGQAF
jgi:outer membrane protein assembly factor BamA/autotransporter translocation and assembly factor TamB